MVNSTTLKIAVVNGDNGHPAEYSNGHTHAHRLQPAPEIADDIEIQLLALMKHRRGIISRVCKQNKPLTRVEFNDPVAGCIYGACACATKRLGTATRNDVLQMLQSWTREENDNAPLAAQGIVLWKALGEPKTAQDDAAAVAIDLAHQVKERGEVAHSITRIAFDNATATRPRFQLFTSNEIKERPAPEYAVAGLLVKNTLAAIVGPSGTLKTFLALDLTGAISTGKMWHRREVNRAPVVYVSGEGSGGLRARIMAWEQHHEQQMHDCHFLTEAVQMLNRKDVDAFIEAMRQLPQAPGLIVLDTLARCIVGGDENSAKDMGEFVAAADRVRVETGATVLIVHHTGKSGDTRGSTALPGAMDTIINVDRHGDYLEVKCGKQKDAEEFATITFARRIVELPNGETSLILEPSEDAYVSLRQSTGKSEEVRNRVLEVLRSTPDGMRAKDWGEAVENAGICKIRSFYTHCDDLQAVQKVEKIKGVYRIKKSESLPTASTANAANAVQMQQTHKDSEVLQKTLQNPPSLEGGCSTCSTDECQDVFDGE